MVSQFYIESREHALRVSEEKYRNSSTTRLTRCTRSSRIP